MSSRGVAYRRNRILVVVALGSGMALSISGCAGGGTGAGAGSSTPPVPTSTASAPSTVAQSGISVTARQATQLCSDLSAQLQNWRTQTPSIGRGGLNIVVQTWAAGSGLINAQVIQDRALIDRITTAACPDVRAGAISALEIPDLASGLVGF